MKIVREYPSWLGSAGGVSLAIVFLAVAILAGCAPESDYSRGVRLMLNTESLDPTTTFELRFDEPVAAESEIGLPARESPLLISPRLAGQFVWLSKRSGVFTPTEPPTLGKAYSLNLRPGLLKSDGKRLTAELHRRLQTPFFSVTAFDPAQLNTNNAPSHPWLQIQFNTDVDARTVRPFIEFHNDAGQHIAAEVRQSTTQDYFNPRYADYVSLTWKQRFAGGKSGAGAVPRRLGSFSSASDEVISLLISNRLIISPANPLPIGNGWKLVLSRGLPSTESGIRLRGAFEIEIGKVSPFTLVEATSHNGLNSGKRIRLNFSKNLSPDLFSTNIMQWISVDPAPPDLTNTVGGNQVELTGGFNLKDRYRVTIRPGLPAAEPFAIRKSVTRELVITPLPPRLYFPTFSADQLTSGNRHVELHSISVSHVRLRAKLLDRNTLVHGLRGYQSYFKESHFDDQERFGEVDFNVVPGRTIFQTNFSVNSTIDETKNIEIEWNQILDGRSNGAVFLVAERRDGAGDESRATLGTETLVQLTDLGVTWKHSPKGYWVHLFSYTTGQSIPQATLRMLTEENEVLVERTTNADGLAEFPALEKGAWLMAEKEGDLHAIKIEDHWSTLMPLYGFNIPIRYSNEIPDRRIVMLFADRPVYRPGETLHLKGLVRDREETTLAIPPGLTGHLQGYDARDQKFWETNVVFSSLGSMDASVPLPLGVRGHYRVELTFTNLVSATHYFQVQDYQPNAFEIKADSPPAFAAGQKVEIPISAQYLLGQKLSKASVHWSLEANDAGFSPSGYDDFWFATHVDYPDLGRGSSSFAMHGETNYSGAKPLTLICDMVPNPKAPQPRAADLLIEMTDLNQQTVAQSVQFIRHSSDYYLGLKRFKEVIRQGELIPLPWVAVRADGTPQAETVKARVSIQKIQWHSVRMQGAGGAITYRNESELVPLLTEETVTRPLQRAGVKWEIQNTEASTRDIFFAPKEPGLYLIEAKAADSGGCDVITAVTVHVSGKEELAWNYRNETKIELVADQPKHLAGQTATILVKTPINGHALVTIERENVLRSFVTNLTGNAPTLQIPLTLADTPNVFVSVLMLRGQAASPRKIKMPEYRLGYCQLSVEDPETRLSVSIESSAKDYRPGQQVQLSVDVRNHTQQAAPGAEVTLYAVDEGILSLAEYATPDPWMFFYASQSLGVKTASSLPNLVPEDPNLLQFGNKGYLVGGGGRTSERTRKNFLPCAFWNATLRTDASGKIACDFAAPDSLTRYRVIAVAHTAKNQFGSGESAFQVNKPLMVEPALPRFANVGDRLLARAVVINQTSQPGEIEVTLECDDTATNSVTSRKLSLAALASGAVEFPVEFKEAGTATWIWRARFLDRVETNFTDTVQSLLTVGYVAPLLTEIHLGRSETPETNLVLKVNPQLLEGKGHATVRVSNTRLLELSEAVSSLLHYPYGCLEQSSSSLLPWLLLPNFPKLFPDLRKTQPEINAVVQHGINRILSMQTSAGGLSYWPGGREPMVWCSAYGGMTLVLAQRAGHTVPIASLDRIAAYLSGVLRQSGAYQHNDDFSDRCFALYTLALAGRAEPSYHELIFEHRDHLSFESRAMLALAILESKGPRQMAEELLMPKKALPFQGNLWFGCPARELAVELLAWSRFQPASPQVDVLVEELMKLQRDAHWTTTQGNAWAVYALTEYAGRVERNGRESRGTLTWGAKGEAFQVNETTPVFETRFGIAPEVASAPMILGNLTGQRLFTNVKLEARPRVSQQPRQDRGFSLLRQFQLVADDGSLHEMKQPRVGDRVLITLRVEVRRSAHYVAVDDPWPTVLEGINPNFKSQQTRAGESLENEWFSDFHELRADRALFFRDHLGPGSYTIRYLARVRSAGTATAPSAKIEEMYHPERLGLTETVEMTSLPME